MVHVSSEEATLRRSLDQRFGHIDRLLGRIPPVEVAGLDELAAAGALTDRVAEELSAIEATARSLQLLTDVTVHSLEVAAASMAAVAAARCAISWVRAQVDSAAA